MQALSEIRKQYPQYNDLSDQALADALHSKFYSDMPKAEFDAKVGGPIGAAAGTPESARSRSPRPPPVTTRNVMTNEQPSPEFRAPMARMDYRGAIPEVGEFIGGGLGAAVGGALGIIPGGPAGVIAGGMAGAGLGATIGQEGGMALSGIPDTRTLPQHAVDAATTFGLNFAGQGLGSAVVPAISATAKTIMRGSGGIAGVRDAISDMARFNETPSVAAATKNSALDSLESFIAGVPGGVGVVRSRAKQTAANVSAAVTAKARALAGKRVNDVIAGRAAIAGVKNFSREFSDKADVLYGELGTFLPSSTPIAVTNTQRVLDVIGKPTAGAEEFTSPLVSPTLSKMRVGLANDAGKNGGGIPYEALSTTRSDIGRQLGDHTLITDLPRGKLKDLYGAITDDLRIAAQAQSPQALKVFDRAHAYYKAGIERIDDMLNPLIKNKVPEQVSAAVENYAQGGPTRITALRKSVSPEQWRVVAANVVNDLGRAAPGQQGVEKSLFSFQKFLTNWQKLDGGAKDVLFNGPNMGGIRGDLDALARASERYIESSKAMANSSGSARNVTGGAMALGGAAGVVTGAGITAAKTIFTVLVLGNRTARMLTNPETVHWLARTASVNPNGLPAQIGRLGAIAVNSDPSTRDAIHEFLGNLQVPQTVN